MSTILRNILFVQGDAADEIITPLVRRHGVTVRGATDATVARALQALLPYDSPDVIGQQVPDTPPNDREERVERDVNGTIYRLTWHTGLSYVSLDEVIGHD